MTDDVRPLIFASACLHNGDYIAECSEPDGTVSYWLMRYAGRNEPDSYTTPAHEHLGPLPARVRHALTQAHRGSPEDEALQLLADVLGATATEATTTPTPDYCPCGRDYRPDGTCPNGKTPKCRTRNETK